MKVFGVRRRFYVIPILLLSIAYVVAAFSKNVEVYYVYGVLPAFVWYTDSGLNDEQEAAEQGILILMRKYLLYHNDKQMILDHELVHVRQAYRTLFISCFATHFSEKYLAKIEAESYALGIDNEENVIIFRSLIKEFYTPNVPEEEIEQYLRYYWNKRLASGG